MMRAIFVGLVAAAALALSSVTPNAQGRIKNSGVAHYNICASGCNYTTVMSALDDMARNIDGGGYEAHLWLADGDWDIPGYYIRPMTGFSSVFVHGNLGNMQAVKLKSTTSTILFQQQEITVANLNFTDMTIDITGLSGCAFGAFQQTNLITRNMRYQGAGSAQQCVFASTVANVILNGRQDMASLGTGGAFAAIGDLGFFSIEPDVVFDCVGAPYSIHYFLQLFRNAVASIGGATFKPSCQNVSGAQWIFNGPGFIDLYNLRNGAMPPAQGYLPGSPASNWNEANQGLVRKGFPPSPGIYEPSNGFTGTKTVRNAAGTGTCTLIYSDGRLSGGSC